MPRPYHRYAPAASRAVIAASSSFRCAAPANSCICSTLVTLAMGFTGTDRENGLVEQFGLDLDERGNIARDADFMTRVPGVFVAGDMGRGQSLIVWAIAEGRSAAAGADRYLMGETKLPDPIEPTARPLM